MKIYNTLTRRKEELVPLTPGRLTMYSCGVTVYDLCHVGHARMMIVFDVISRYLRFAGYQLTFVRNFTDIDDKIIRRAQQEGVAASEISERYIAAFREDIAALGALAPEVEPKATENVTEMIALIERLVAGGYAYVIDGDVYFEIARFPPYGTLVGQEPGRSARRARVSTSTSASGIPRDFALWKSAKPGEPSWESPWGPGRPGWHIECSAMAMKLPGADLRHPRRRRRPHLPASRVRDRPVGGGHGQAVRAVLAAQRHGQHGRREDVEVPRQHAVDPRDPQAPRRRRRAPVGPRHALPQSARVRRGATRRGRPRARAAVGACPRRSDLAGVAEPRRRRHPPGRSRPLPQRLRRRDGRRLQHAAGAGRVVRDDAHPEPARGSERGGSGARRARARGDAARRSASKSRSPWSPRSPPS